MRVRHWSTLIPRSSEYIEGMIIKDSRTKRLLRRLKPGNIAVIDHEDLDEVAARALVEKRPRAVINAAKTLSGTYPTPGPKILYQAGIPVLDEVGKACLDKLNDGMTVWIDGERFGIFDKDAQQILLGFGHRLTEERLNQLSELAHNNFESALEKFIDNTLTYAAREKGFVTRPFPLPRLRTKIKGRHVVVVVRGANYRADLYAIRSYIRDYRPVLIGVDGGADALIEHQFMPHIIIGDMDSVSDEALLSGAELIVHAYPNGEAPGLERIHHLGLKAHTIPSIGTSEDVAMLLAFEKKAELIVAIGTHSHMVDFLEKGRKGMASTLLVRMKIGTRLIDAKGVNVLYQGKYRGKELTFVALSSTFPVIALFGINPDFRQFVKLLWLNVRMMFS